MAALPNGHCCRASSELSYPLAKMYGFRMRLALWVNDQKITRASLEGKGFLSAHLNLSGGSVGEGGSDLSLVAYDTSEEPSTVRSVWLAPSPAVGDKIEIHVLPDGESDPPLEVIRSTNSASNLFSQLEQARLLLLAIKACDDALMNVVRGAQETEPPAEFEKIRVAVGSVLSELDGQLISPTLRNHPSLRGVAQQLGLY